MALEHICPHDQIGMVTDSQLKGPGFESWGRPAHPFRVDKSSRNDWAVMTTVASKKSSCLLRVVAAMSPPFGGLKGHCNKRASEPAAARYLQAVSCDCPCSAPDVWSCGLPRRHSYLQQICEMSFIEMPLKFTMHFQYQSWLQVGLAQTGHTDLT